MSQELRDALFIASDFQANFKQIIAKRSDLVKFARGRMVTPGAETIYYAGTVLGQVTSSGQFKPYVSSATDGSQVAVGILSEYADVDTAGNGGEIAVIVGGALYKDRLIGLDSTAITALAARSYVESGNNILDF
jgi:Bacteriophage lambda head decoration protein D